MSTPSVSNQAGNAAALAGETGLRCQRKLSEVPARLARYQQWPVEHGSSPSSRYLCEVANSPGPEAYASYAELELDISETNLNLVR